MTAWRSLLLAAALLAAAPGGAAVPHVLLPWQAQAGKAFDLMLAGPYACNFSFSHESTYVKQDRIVLAFLATEIPNIRCAPMTQPFGPEFRLPALAAGEYPIYSQSLAPCMVGPAPCDLHVEPVLVGTLKVTPGAAYDSGWFLHPKRVESGKDVRVGLLNRDRGSCENGFQPARDTVRARTADLRFQTLYFRRLCETSVHPFGPEFSLGELKPGSYRVEGYDLPACAFEEQPCIPLKPWEPVLVDTLVVAGGSPVRRPGAPGRSAAAVGRAVDARGRHLAPAGARTPVLRVIPLSP